MRTTIRAGMIGLTAVAGAFMVPIPAAGAESFAGHWHLLFHGTCVLNVANQQACRDLQGPAEFPVFNTVGASLSVLGVGDYISDAHGHYRVRFTTTIREIVPRGRAAVQCNNWLVFSSTFTGTCIERGTGHGHIARGRTGMPDFWQDDATGYWQGPHPARFSETTSTDTFNPACAGNFDTKRFMAFFGYHGVPRGITARVILTHRP